MPFPLLPLLGSQVVRLVGTHSLRSLATQTMFKLGENVLLKQVMPRLGEPLSLGANFIPGRSGAVGSLLKANGLGVGQLLGRSDILKELSGKALAILGDQPGPLTGALGSLRKLCGAFEVDQNASGFLQSLKGLQGPLQGLAGNPALAALGGEISDMIERILTGQAAPALDGQKFHNPDNAGPSR